MELDLKIDGAYRRSLFGVLKPIDIANPANKKKIWWRIVLTESAKFRYGTLPILLKCHPFGTPVVTDGKRYYHYDRERPERAGWKSVFFVTDLIRYKCRCCWCRCRKLPRPLNEVTMWGSCYVASRGCYMSKEYRNAIVKAMAIMGDDR